jgi:heat shock protein 4
MYLGKLRDIAANELKSAVTDIVIAVPGWFTDSQRRAMLDAAQIAGLNVLRLINDSTAVALGYGITKSDLPDVENPRHVVFVDLGHSNLTVSIIGFSKGQFVVKGSAFNHNLGGRDIDRALVEHFSAQFKEKYKIDVLGNPKATFRLAAGCEKLKKVLSANTDATLNVESIMNDIDVHSKLNREEFEQLIAHVLEGISRPIKEAIEHSGLSPEQIDSIELVGGSTRIPAVRQRILAEFPGKQLSFTLNQDEAVARGATFACAMLSPVFKVREFSMHDVTPYTIKVRWDRSPDDEDTELVVFPRGNSIPSTKILTFYRKEPFDLEAVYADPAALPGSTNPWIAKFTAKQVGPVDSKGENAPVKVKVRLNTHGVVSFEQLYYEEIEEKEEAAMEVDGSAEPAQPKKKRIVRKKDLPFVTGTTSLDASILDSFREAEANMHASDKLVMDTEVSHRDHVHKGRVSYALCRIGRTLSKSISMTCAARSMTSMRRSRSLRRRLLFSQRFKRLRTGCTPMKVKMPPNPLTSSVWTS